jgi:hypothetical protein
MTEPWKKPEVHLLQANGECTAYSGVGIGVEGTVDAAHIPSKANSTDDSGAPSGTSV